jgi:hypothetical protein
MGVEKPWVPYPLATYKVGSERDLVKFLAGSPVHHHMRYRKIFNNYYGIWQAREGHVPVSNSHV